jgi:hypothetical protein
MSRGRFCSNGALRKCSSILKTIVICIPLNLRIILETHIFILYFAGYIDSYQRYLCQAALANQV